MKLKTINPVVLISFLFVLGSCAFFAVAADPLSQKTAVFRDADKDGLSDDEEGVYGTDPANPDSDGDSYSDGVEVKSGYDPLKPAPGDKIAASATPAVLGESTEDENNMTSKLSEGLADFIEENDGKEGEMSVEDLDMIIQESIGGELNKDDSVFIDEGLIRVKKQDYAGLSEEERVRMENEDAVAYFKSILYVLVSNAPREITSEDDLAIFFEDVAIELEKLASGSTGSQDGYFSDWDNRGKIISEQIQSVEVPESLLGLHKEGLQLLAQALNLEMTVTIDPDDQIGMIVNLSKIQAVVESGISFQENFTLAMDKYDIKSGYALILSY